MEKFSTKKRFLISFLLFWGIGYLSFQQFLHEKSWSVELLFVFLAGYISTVFIQHTLLKIIVKIFLGIVLTVFIAQAIFVFKNGEYISTLAIENINQLYLVMGYKEYCILILIFSFLLILLISLRNITTPKTEVITNFVICALLIGVSIFISRDVYSISYKKFPSFAFFNTLYSVYRSHHIDKNYQNLTGYPFMKKSIYHSKLPFPPLKTKDKPNIILILTEGTSARLIGAYGGKFPQLTPHLDEFAKQSTLITNYFNHTAATFRGTQGQLGSFWPRLGGYYAENIGWAKDGKNLSKVNYQTLPKILNSWYQTIFVSPHVSQDPYTMLVKSLGFKKILTADDTSITTNQTSSLHHSSTRDDVMYQKLENLLQTQQDNQPFFITMYTFGTHTNVDVPKDIKTYSNYKESNETLNTLHFTDQSFGKFWNYFTHSKYKDNTILIFTVDHAHYYDNKYTPLVEHDSDYTRTFHDKIPLIIYDPIHQLPSQFDANDSSSIDLAPTILHLLGINNIDNNFMGSSIFEEKTSNDAKVVATGETFYAIYQHKIWDPEELPAEQKEKFQEKKNLILKFYEYETANQIFKENYQG